LGQKFRSNLVPVLVLAAGVMCISSGSIFVRLADAPSLVKSAYRIGISALFFVPLALAFSRDELKRMTKRDFSLSAVAGFFLAIHFATWITSLDYTTVASSVILVNTIPIWIAVGNAVLGIMRPSRVMCFCVSLSVLGAGIVGYGDIAFDTRALFGDMLAILGAIAAAIYIMCGKEVRGKFGLITYVALCYGSAAVFVWIAVLVMGYPIIGYSPITWGAMAALAVMPQIIGHTSYNWALGYFSAGFIGIMLLGEPIGSSVLAYFLFGEVPTPVKFVGFALLMIAIALAARDEKPSQAPPG